MLLRILSLAVLLWIAVPGRAYSQEIGTDSEQQNASSYILQMQLGALVFGAQDVFAHTFLTIGCAGKFSIIPSLGTYWRIATGVSNKLPYFIEWRDEAFYLLDVNLLVDFNEHGTIPDMSSAMSVGISTIKPFVDSYPVKDFGSTTAYWYTSNWLNTLHLYISFAFRFHPSMIELSVRIPWTRSIQEYNRFWAFDQEGHIFFGLSYAYLIGL